MNKMYKWLLILATFLVVASVIYFSGNRTPSIKVTADSVKRSDIVETVSASGKIYPVNEVRISPDISGELTELNVEEGESVQKGDVVAKIRSTGNFFLPGSESREIIIKAPINGIVSMINVSIGERVVGTAQVAGTEIMNVADMSSFEVRVEVGENDILKVKKGDKAEVNVEAYDNRKFNGEVRKIATNTNRNNPLQAMGNENTGYMVYIRLDPASYSDLLNLKNSGRFIFRSGMNASAEIKTNKKENVLSVPISAVAAVINNRSSAVTSDEDEDEIGKEKRGVSEEIVWVINKEDKTEKKVVKTGIQDVEQYEIISGLKEGEKIVTGPASVVNELKTGSKVKIVSREKLYQ